MWLRQKPGKWEVRCSETNRGAGPLWLSADTRLIAASSLFRMSGRPEELLARMTRS